MRKNIHSGGDRRFCPDNIGLSNTTNIYPGPEEKKVQIILYWVRKECSQSTASPIIENCFFGWWCEKRLHMVPQITELNTFPKNFSTELVRINEKLPKHSVSRAIRYRKI